MSTAPSWGWHWSWSLRLHRGICLRKRWNHHDQDLQRDGPQTPQGGRGASRHWLEAIHGGFDLSLTQRPTGNLHHSQRIQHYRRAMGNRGNYKATCNESNTLQNVAHKMCTPHMVSTRSLGHYACECISGILSPEDTWDYGMILAILGCVTQEPLILALQNNA